MKVIPETRPTQKIVYIRFYHEIPKDKSILYYSIVTIMS